MEVERILKDFKIRILGVILLILTCFPNIALPEDFALSKEEADELIMSARNIIYKD